MLSTNRFFGVMSLLLAFSFSCCTFAANRPNNTFTDSDIPKFKAGAKILVLPLNSGLILKQQEVDDVEKEVIKQLSQVGAAPIQGRINNQQDYVQYLIMTSPKGFQSTELHAAKAEFAREVGGNYELVVMPTVYQAAGELKVDYLYLEGAKIKIEFKGSINANFNGKQLGTVLRLDIITSNGHWLMAVQGGIAMPSYANLHTHEFIRKEYLFARKADKNSLRKGVNIAIKPVKKKLKFK
ncbi:hypothetical protein P886_0466 [Alteromonadaceae bacterium 2753L.S.0a.02]|nr:hypothetical protein P886_0466 [Alteromonadaceae bacterium 2753L.S.0a.02]